MIKTVACRRLVIGFFSYWIGFSWRGIKCARVLDCGFIKFWWSR